MTFGSSELAENPALAWGLLAAFGLLLTVFCLKELKSRYPLLDIRMLARNRVFALSSLAAFVNYSSFFGMIFFFSLYLQAGRGMSVQEAGLFLALQSVAQVLTTPLAARLCNAWEPAKVSARGRGTLRSGTHGGGLFGSGFPTFAAVGRAMPAGRRHQSFALPNTTIILESAGADHVGQASGLTGAVRTGGQLCNMVVITLTLGFFLGRRRSARTPLTPFCAACARI